MNFSCKVLINLILVNFASYWIADWSCISFALTCFFANITHAVVAINVSNVFMLKVNQMCHHHHLMAIASFHLRISLQRVEDLVVVTICATILRIGYTYRSLVFACFQTEDEVVTFNCVINFVLLYFTVGNGSSLARLNDIHNVIFILATI